MGEANAGSPSQAKFRKKVEESTDSPSKAKVPALKSGASTGSPKRAGSGFSDKVPRMTCFGSSDGPVPEKKPSLAERYSAWKVSLQPHVSDCYTCNTQQAHAWDLSCKFTLATLNTRLLQIGQFVQELPKHLLHLVCGTQASACLCSNLASTHA